MIEHRITPRWAVSRNVRLKIEGDENHLEGNIINMSFEGMEINLKQELPQDKFIRIKLQLYEAVELDIEAWVAWHKQSDESNLYGFYFNRISNTDKQKIYKYVYKYVSWELNKYWQKSSSESKGGETMEDRRIFARFSAKFPVKYLEVESGREGEASALDISAKGIGLTTQKHLQPATPVEVWLNIPDRGEPLYTRGQVVWSKELQPNKYRSGIALERADLMGLSRFMRVRRFQD